MSGGLIVTADDFGLHPAVNAAVERACRDGILTAASLMVGAPAAADAIARARTLPGLRVGLHVVLADGPSVLPPRTIPDLVDAHGRFGTHMARAGVRYFCLPRVRRQLAREIRAQFDAFAASGLALDHVNAHKHFHLHPTILSLILYIGREFGLRAVRLPRETGPPWWLRPWLALLEARLDAAGIDHNDYVIGLRQSGRFDEAALLAALDSLPTSGIGELYLHPALESGAVIAPSMRDYRHADEFAGLVAPRVRALRDALRAQGWRYGGFADLLAPVGGTAGNPCGPAGAPGHMAAQLVDQAGAASRTTCQRTHQPGATDHTSGDDRGRPDAPPRTGLDAGMSPSRQRRNVATVSAVQGRAAP
jgi:hopanoid biosynthesis associated protein HpnK